ncbi:hypothetical protein HD597_004473 [Nonomuraea thailandensis]|uniref:Uncharacterized protein n=1 Tax=Nonomuraea thailandensis TaxID=1188745 RepID=A0A9X2GMQ2_9ACTN|nr:hypothetical protein [Nonomuraea thailandensis]
MRRGPAGPAMAVIAVPVAWATGFLKPPALTETADRP